MCTQNIIYSLNEQNYGNTNAIINELLFCNVYKNGTYYKYNCIYLEMKSVVADLICVCVCVKLISIY